MASQVCPVGDCVLPAGHGIDHSPNIARLVNHRFDRLETILGIRFAEMEKTMSDVAGIEASAIADLQNAVNDLTNRLGSLPQALADAQAALAQALATDATDVAARDAALATVQQNLDQAVSLSGQIEESVAAINAISAPAAAPAEPAPAPTEVPVEPSS